MEWLVLAVFVAVHAGIFAVIAAFAGHPVWAGLLTAMSFVAIAAAARLIMGEVTP